MGSKGLLQSILCCFRPVTNNFIGRFAQTGTCLSEKSQAELKETGHWSPHTLDSPAGRQTILFRRLGRAMFEEKHPPWPSRNRMTVCLDPDGPGQKLAAINSEFRKVPVPLVPRLSPRPLPCVHAHRQPMVITLGACCPRLHVPHDERQARARTGRVARVEWGEGGCSWGVLSGS